MELQALHDELIAAGCNRFYIVGIGGPQSDDVECLSVENGEWVVYYTERGQASKPLFSTPDKQKAIQFYYQHILSLEHWHLITFTRSSEIMTSRKQELQAAGIGTIQNDIPSYNRAGDHVFRLFVINKDIFKARQVLAVIPYFDDDLSR
jgi:hypothetical protein